MEKPLESGFMRIKRSQDMTYSQCNVCDVVDILVMNGYRVQIELSEDRKSFEVLFGAGKDEK